MLHLLSKHVFSYVQLGHCHARRLPCLVSILLGGALCGGARVPPSTDWQRCVGRSSLRRCGRWITESVWPSDDDDDDDDEPRRACPAATSVVWNIVFWLDTRRSFLGLCDELRR